MNDWQEYERLRRSNLELEIAFCESKAKRAARNSRICWNLIMVLTGILLGLVVVQLLQKF